jgi:hypothetical protein
LQTGIDVENALAVDADHVYFASNGTVSALALDGGSPVPLATGQNFSAFYPSDSNLMVLANGSLYWATGTTVASVPAAGGTVTTLASNQGSTTSIAVDSAHVFWTDSSARTVMSAPISGGETPTPVASSQNGLVAVALDASNVYWMTSVSSGATTVFRVSKSGGTPVQVAATKSTADNPVATDLIVSGGKLYWIASQFGSGSVVSVPVGAGTPKVLVAPPLSLSSFVRGPSSFYLGTVYASADGHVVGAITGLAADGALNEITVTSSEARALVADATSVYWIGGASLFRVSL